MDGRRRITASSIAGLTSGVTLDGAYDFGGAGVGRTITADAGAVAMTSAAADNNNILTLTKNPAGAQTGTVLAIAATPGASAAMFGQTITMGALTSSTGRALGVTWASVAGNADGIVRISLDINAPFTGSTAAVTILKLDSKSQYYTLGNAGVANGVTALAIDLSTNIQTNVPSALIGVDVTLGADASLTSSRGVRVTSAQTLGTLLDLRHTGPDSTTGVRNLFTAIDTTNGEHPASNDGYVALFARGDGTSYIGSGHNDESAAVCVDYRQRLTSGGTHSGGAFKVLSRPDVVAGACTVSGAIARIEHSPTITGGSLTDTATGFSIAMTPASSAAVTGQTITMSSLCTGAALTIAHSGAAPVIASITDSTIATNANAGLTWTRNAVPTGSTTWTGKAISIQNTPTETNSFTDSSTGLVTINHAPIAGAGTMTDSTVGLLITMTPIVSATGNGAQITMGANATGHALSITQNGSGAGVKFASSFAEMTEMTAPTAGAANTVRIYSQDNGAGKTQLMALFNSGAAQQLAIEP